MAVLAVAQQAAGAADLQVPHGDAHPRTEGRELPDGRQPLGRHFGEDPVPAEGEVGVCLAGRPAHPAADLVQLGQAHAVGVLNDQGVAVAHVHPGLDEGGADQQVDLVVQQLLPDRGDLFLGHLAMGDAHPGAGHHLGDAGGAGVDVPDLVVQVVDLPAPGQFLADGLSHDAGVVFQHIGLDGLALEGGLLDHRHIPDAGQRHVQRAGDRGGREGQHIHPHEVFLELFLVFDPEALFLVDDEQAQVLELHIVGQQPMGPHHDVHGAVPQPAQRLLLFLGAAVAGQQPDADGERLHAGEGGVEMLPGQDGGGGQDRALLAAHHAFEGRPQRHLGLADPHVAAQQPVHRPGLFHVVLDLGGGRQLVGGLLIGEALFKVPLPGVVRREGVAPGLLAAGVQLDELLGHRLGGGPDPPAGLVPVAAAQPAQPHLVRVAGGGVAGEQVQLGDRDVEHVLFVVFDAQVVLGDPLHLHAADARIPADAVVLVDHQVAGGDLGQAVEGILGALLFAADGGLAKGPGRDHRIAGKGQLAPGGQVPGQHLHLPGGGRGRRVGGDRQPLGPQVLAEPGGGAGGAGQHRDRQPLPPQRGQVFQQRGHLAAPGGQAVAGGVDHRLQRLVGQAAGKVFGQQGAVAPGPGPEPFGRGVQVVQPGAEGAVVEQGGQLLAPAVGGGPVGLPDGGRLLDEEQRVLQVVQQGGPLGVAHVQVPVHRRRHRPGVQLGQVGGHDRLHRGALFPPLLFPVGPQRGGGLLRRTEQHLPRRAQVDLLHRFVPALGGQVEGVHRVDLVPPELHAGRGLHVGGVQVQDVAPDGKLPRAVHPVPAHIAGAQQQRGELVPLQGVAGVQRTGVGAEIRRGHRVLGQPLAGHADRLQPPAGQVPQHGQTAVLVFPAGALDGAQQVIPGREDRGRHPQRVQVGGEAGGLGLAGGDDAQRAPQRPAQRRIHQRPAGRRQPEQCAGPLAGQRPRQLFVFFGLQKQRLEHKSPVTCQARSGPLYYTSEPSTFVQRGAPHDTPPPDPEPDP